MTNLKSDVAAKMAFALELELRGFKQVRITGSPADITAIREGAIHYFEIKYTSKQDRYFGAATLTEWVAALENEDRFSFVVAAHDGEGWAFHEYTPSEFMEFSYIPPFKVFFNVAVGGEKATHGPSTTKRVQLTKTRVLQMLRLYRTFQSRG